MIRFVFFFLASLVVSMYFPPEFMLGMCFLFGKWVHLVFRDSVYAGQLKL